MRSKSPLVQSMSKAAKGDMDRSPKYEDCFDYKLVWDMFRSSEQRSDERLLAKKSRP